ncbi:HNH endonuclease [Terriglobus roseus]|uniref:HNH endonuclease n=1 Tax=Terriglobus roseus TaxID=392734 RepID=UPI003D7892C3
MIPINQRPDLRLILSNLQSLCRSCHVLKTKREQRVPPSQSPGITECHHPPQPVSCSAIALSD